MKYIEFSYNGSDLSVITKGVINGGILKSKFEDYGTISMTFSTNKILKPIIVDQGFGGIILEEHQIPLFEKDYDASEKPSRWITNFDLTNWVMVVVVGTEHQLLAGGVIAMQTDDVHLLRGRNDLAVLWDIRVNEVDRSKGLGRLLFEEVIKIAKSSGMIKMHIETQNNNYGACKFYSKMGCHLIRIDMDSYPDLPNEVQLLWQHDLI